jgi:hypothetical protein
MPAFGLHLGVIQPYRLVFPTSGHLQSVSRFFDGNFPLEPPFIIEHVRPAVILNLVANHVSHVAGRDFQSSYFKVRNEVTAHQAQRTVDRVLVLDFVILSLLRNTPRLHASNSRVMADVRFRDRGQSFFHILHLAATVPPGSNTICCSSSDFTN